MDKELKKQIKKINKREDKILNKKESGLFESKLSPIKDKIQNKIPDRLKVTLKTAFLKGFQLVFEKGNTYIEKTYNKEHIKLEYDLNNYAIDKKLNRKHIKRLDKQANQSRLINSSLTILEGGVLGFLGIGLPDIPVFISVIMKTIYEVALGYGYDYSSNKERAYILLIICGALTKGEQKKEFNEKINKLAEQIDQQIQIEINLKEYMEISAQVLSDAMLTSKFIQGIPVIGVVGGAVNYKIIKKIGEYASLKYKKRYLSRKV